MKDMILFPEDIDRLNAVLGQLVNKANLLLAVLINKDGRLLTNQGSLEHIDTQSLAALVAGNSASTLAIANLMGETEFSTMYHQGKDKNIYIALVDENTFIALVFDDRTNIDRVKVFARQFDRQLKESLVQVYNKTEDQIDLDLDMGGASFEVPQTTDPQQQSEAPYDVYNPPKNPPNQHHPAASAHPAHQHQDKKTKQDQAEYIEMGKKNPAVPHAENEEIFYIDGQRQPVQENQPLQPGEQPVDTKYLYLQNKIRETIKGKNSKPD